MPLFGIVLEHPESGRKAFETLELSDEYPQGANRARAAAAAEVMVPGYTAVAVTTRHQVRGRCTECNAVLFTDQPAAEGRDGLRCFDCG